MLYRVNETMAMIGHQRMGIVYDGSETEKAFHEVLRTYKNDGQSVNVSLAIDCFMLGFINGKREERKRRKRNIKA